MFPYDDEDLLPSGWGADRAPAGAPPLVAAPAFYPTPTGAPPALKAALARRLAPKKKALPRPDPTVSVPTEAGSPTADPQTQQAQNTSRAARTAFLSGFQNEARSQLQQKESRTDNMPTVVPDYLIDGGDEDPHETAFAKKRMAAALLEENPSMSLTDALAAADQHPPVRRQGVLNSLNKLKAGLDAWQQAKASQGRNDELRALIVSHMGGQPDISPALSLIESNTGAKLGRQSNNSTPMGKEFLDQVDGREKRDTQLAALEEKLLDDVLIQKGTTYNFGTSATEGAKTNTPPPPKGKDTGGGIDQKQLKEYLKMTKGSRELTATLDGMEAALGKIPKDQSSSMLGSLGNAARYKLYQETGSPTFLSPAEQELETQRSSLITQANHLFGLNRWNQGEVDMLTKKLGGGGAATPQFIKAGIDYIRSIEAIKHQEAADAYPDIEPYMNRNQGQRRPAPARAGKRAVSGADLSAYAAKYKMSPDAARKHLTEQGYSVGQ